MKEQDLKQLWKNANSSTNEESSPTEDMRRHLRKQTSDRIYLNLKKGFIFDIILKSLITATVFLYMVFNKINWVQEPASMFTLVFLSAFLLSAMIGTYIISVRRFKRIPQDLPVLQSLKRKLDYVKTTYRKFMFGSALTAPLFVFTGNIIYFHRKYGEVRFDDPIILIFIFLSFIIAYFAQIPLYNILKRELEEAISDLDEDKAKELAVARKKQTIQYLIWALAGLIVLILFFVLFKAI